MNTASSLSLLFVSSVASSILLTKFLIKFLSFVGVFDTPNYRRIHNVITPRGGGLSILVVFIAIGSLFIHFVPDLAGNFSEIIPIFFLISLISFIDDLIAVSVIVRLMVHIMCASLTILLFLYPKTLFHQEISPYLDFMLSTIGLVAFLNIYNFLDGIDGITSIQSVHLSITMLIICYLKSDIILNVHFITITSIIILGCSISFLIFNWPPAKIFLGDVGSIGLGFLIGVCLLLISASSVRLFAAASIASLYYIADGGLTIVIRLINKEKIWQPHLKHFFQQAIKKGMTNRQVITKIMICNFLLMILSINALYYPSISVITAVIVVMVTLINFAK